MEISPAVPAPKSGDPITAKWASDLAAAVNSCANPSDRAGDVSTPYGKASPAPGLPMLGQYSPVMPFDVRLVWDGANQVHDVWCALPYVSGSSLVYAYGEEAMASGQVGSPSAPWVKVGSVADGALCWLVLALTPPFRTDGTINVVNHNWGVELQTVQYSGDPPTLPAWAWDQSPTIPIAFIRTGHTVPQGFVQFVRGAIHIGTPAVAPFAVAANLKINSIGDANGVEWLGQAAGGYTVARKLNLGLVPSFFNSRRIDSETIVDQGGNSHTVLVLVTP